KKVQFRFCAECANLLYPDEDKTARQLLFTCKNCGYNEKATTACTYRNVLHNTASETAGVTADLAQDPTLPRSSIPCPACSETEAVFFQSQQRNDLTGMRIWYVCTGCSHIWQ
ncbi:hypothetical protein K490DRAFT_2911, partial [Saccharata proteae CBS 121410]